MEQGKHVVLSGVNREAFSFPALPDARFAGIAVGPSSSPGSGIERRRSCMGVEGLYASSLLGQDYSSYNASATYSTDDAGSGIGSPSSRILCK